MKKFFILAFVSAAFFFGCSADGFITPSGDTVWSKDVEGNPGPGPGPGPNPGGSGYCLNSGNSACLKMASNFNASNCSAVNGSAAGSCNGPWYCFNYDGYEDCDWTVSNASEDADCTSQGGLIVNLTFCALYANNTY
ncbi:MAG: hypothetical protein FWH22_07675 [Fibromonadales bacterium]|nr:hypothetical protein [Fibromonadales bacterium]